jgi:hypothetical protein
LHRLHLKPLTPTGLAIAGKSVFELADLSIVLRVPLT